MNRIATGCWALVGALLLAVCGNAAAQADTTTNFKEGVHYEAIENAPAATGSNVEVAEAFSYLCSHCATFEPYISKWVQNKPENVTFRRIPIVFGRTSWEIYAQAYVTADLMGIADKAHGALMDKLWKEKSVMRSIDELAQFYAAFGVDPEKFVATSKSFAVNAKMRKDQHDAQAAGVRGTPSIIVNGKYLVSGNEAVPSYDVLLDVVDFLISRESAAQNTAAAGLEAAARDTMQMAGN